MTEWNQLSSFVLKLMSSILDKYLDLVVGLSKEHRDRSPTRPAVDVNSINQISDPFAFCQLSKVRPAVLSMPWQTRKLFADILIM